jgi:hypothetical protein
VEKDMKPIFKLCLWEKLALLFPILLSITAVILTEALPSFVSTTSPVEAYGVIDVIQYLIFISVVIGSLITGSIGILFIAPIKAKDVKKGINFILETRKVDEDKISEVLKDLAQLY